MRLYIILELCKKLNEIQDYKSNAVSDGWEQNKTPKLLLSN